MKQGDNDGTEITVVRERITVRQDGNRVMGEDQRGHKNGNHSGRAFSVSPITTFYCEKCHSSVLLMKGHGNVSENYSRLF